MSWEHPNRRSHCLAQIRDALATVPPRRESAGEGAAAAPTYLPCPRGEHARLRAVSPLPPRAARSGSKEADVHD